jgi:hypothetical protein
MSDLLFHCGGVQSDETHQNLVDISLMKRSEVQIFHLLHRLPHSLLISLCNVVARNLCIQSTHEICKQCARNQQIKFINNVQRVTVDTTLTTSSRDKELKR